MSSQLGAWEDGGAPDVVAVHMALLRTGKVLLYTGNEENTFAHINDGKSKIWDPKTYTFTNCVLTRNLFCCGHCFLPDGRLLISGGQSMAQGLVAAILWLLRLARGADIDLHTFDPITEQWEKLADMERERWYPTLTTLPDGRVLIASGFASHVLDSISRFLGIKSSATNETYEVFDGKTNSIVERGEFWKGIALYPYIYVLPGGNLFVHSTTETRLFDSNTMSWLPHQFDLPSPNGTVTYPGMGPCALLPINWDGSGAIQVLVVGGSTDLDPQHETPATNAARLFIYDRQNPSQSTWLQTTPMSVARFLSDTVLLPDGTILCVNGAEKGQADHSEGDVLTVELFDPKTEIWHMMEDMTIPRLYHSTAVLLPDARVVVGGSTGHHFPEVDNEFRLEVFSPPYLFKGARPVISNAPETITYDTTFEVDTPDASSITSIALIRPGSVTHNNNMDQRHINLGIATQDTDKLTIQTPLDATIAPPAYYMLFLLNDQGVPSEAVFVQVSHD